MLSCWSLRIDNFADVHATAKEWVAEHPVQSQACFSKATARCSDVSEAQALVSGVEVADLAELTWSNQLRLAVRMRWDLSDSFMMFNTFNTSGSLHIQRLLFGAHGDGLSWSVFMGAGSAWIQVVCGASDAN